MSEAIQPVFTIEKIYLKDLSVEVPNAPRIFLERESPQVDVNIHSEGKEIDPGHYEVVLTVTLTAKLKERTVFLVEVAQAGLFQIRNVPPQDVDPLLGVACPNILFAYLRETVTSVTTRAGFPPVQLAPMTFEGLYQQRLQQLQEQQKQQQANPAPH